MFFDKRAVEKNQVVFHDVAAIEVRVHSKKNTVAVELTDFSVFYSQDSIAIAEASLKNGGSKVVVDAGQIVKVTKDKQGVVTRETLTKSWTDWIDYWSVDFNYESKREIIRVRRDLDLSTTPSADHPADEASAPLLKPGGELNPATPPIEDGSSEAIQEGKFE